MGTTNFEDSTVVAVRGDSSAHSDQVFTRTIGEVADTLGVTPGDRRSVIENVADLSSAAIAVSTPSMFSDRRIVVLDEMLDAAALKRLIEAGSGNAVVVTRCGSRSNPKPSVALTVIDARPPRTDGDRRAQLAAAVERSGVTLDAAARTALLDRVGAEGASLDATLLGLAHASAGSTVDAGTVAALVPEGATATPFAFVDTIEAGNLAGSLEHLARLSGPSAWAPLRTLGLLRNRWVGAWRISQGAPVPDGYGGKQIAALARRLGPARLGDGVAHIAAAEADIKGGSRLDPAAVLEVCVARLARLAKTR